MIVVQVMEAPEVLDERTLVLLVCKRDVGARTYSVKQEEKFTWAADVKFGPQLSHLKAFCRGVYGYKDEEHIEIAKFVPYNFEWKFMDGNDSIEMKKGKKGKQRQKVKIANVDLRQQPFHLSDGDIIGVRLEKDNKDGDDWQTEEDEIAKAQFDLIKEEKRKEQALAKAAKAKGNDDVGLHIDLGD